MAVSNTQPSANRWSFLGDQSTAMQREGFDGALSTVDEQNEGVNRKSDCFFPAFVVNYAHNGNLCDHMKLLRRIFNYG